MNKELNWTPIIVTFLSFSLGFFLIIIGLSFDPTYPNNTLISVFFILEGTLLVIYILSIIAYLTVDEGS